VDWRVVSTDLVRGDLISRHGANGFSLLSEGRHAEGFFARKTPTASAGFEQANLGTSTLTTTPPKPLSVRELTYVCVVNRVLITAQSQII
jgi:hypothetical protein